MHSQHCTAGPLAVDGTHSVSLIHSDIGVVGGGGVSSVQKIFVVRVNGIAVLVIVRAGYPSNSDTMLCALTPHCMHWGEYNKAWDKACCGTQKVIACVTISARMIIVLLHAPQQ